MVHSEGFLRLVNAAKERVQQIDIEQYKAMREASVEHVLIDIREQNEWSAGHVQGALYVGKGIIERDIERTVPDQSATIVLYCGGGYRSALAADALQQMGYTRVISLDGGWRALEASGLPLER